ncbi:MAG TPA: cytochrome b/b6 domain-containing protein [Acidimicrobiales bacterium]|nr:cytochrome b/b6 domain-containing protein [Acidimicrobiales bacterium]
MADGRGVLRFDGVQRAAHWLTAILFGILIATAFPLYFASVESLVGRHVLVLRIHVAAGIALPFPVVVSLLGPWGARMRADLGRFNRWSEPELRWLRSLGTRRMPRADKFNPGQKLFAVFVGGSIAVMFGTGVVMAWFDLFPVSWRVGATVVHEVLAWLVSLAILGHIAMVATHPGSMRSMLNGRVSETWARRHCPSWLEDQLGAPGEEEFLKGRAGARRVSWRAAERSHGKPDSSTTNSRSGRSGIPNRSSP